MKKQFLILLLTGASLAGYAAVPAGLPETLPDNAIGYEEVSSVSDIVAGERYVIRPVFSSSSTVSALFLTHVQDTENSESTTQWMAELKTTDDISDPNSIVWTATTVTADNSAITNIISFTNGGRYFSTRHNAAFSDLIKLGVSGTGTNYVQGICTLEEQSLNTGVVLTQSNPSAGLPDGISSTFVIDCNSVDGSNSTSTPSSTAMGTRLLANIGTSNSANVYEFAATSNSTTCSATTTAYFAIYRVVPNISYELPSALPDGISGYKAVTSVSDIVAGKKYVLLSVFPKGSQSNAILTNVDVDGQRVAEWKTIDEISDLSTIVWDATAVTASNSGISNIIALKNNDTYFSTRHNSNYSDQVIAGGSPAVGETAATTRYNLVKGIYSSSEQNLYTGIVFSDYTTSLSSMKYDAIGAMRISCNTYNATSTTALGTNLMTYYDYSTSSGYEIGAGSGSTAFAAASSAYFSVYLAVAEESMEDEMAELKTKYKTLTGYMASFDSQAVTDAQDAIDAISLADGNNNLDNIEGLMRSIVGKLIGNIFSGKVIAVKSVNSSKYLGISSAGAVQTTTDKDIYSFWTPVITVDESSASGATVVLQSLLGNYQIGSAAAAASGADVAISADAGVAYELVPFAADKFLFRTGSLMLNTNSGLSKAIYWGQADTGSQWAVSVCDESEVYNLAYADITNSTKILDADKTIGSNLSEYTDTFEPTRQAFLTEYSDAESVTDFSTFVAAYKSTKAVMISTDTYALNMPVSGRYLRIMTGTTRTANLKSTITTLTTPYLSCNNVTVNSYSRAQYVDGIESDENKINTIFYLSDDTAAGYFRLTTYATGRYACHYNNFLGIANSVSDNTAANIIFGSAPTPAEVGGYTIKSNNGYRWLYTQSGTINSETVLYTDGGGGGNEGYTFQLSYVYELPLLLLSDGQASIHVPVPLQIPEDYTDCTFYVGQQQPDNTIIFHKAKPGEVYAANTFIFVNGSADSYVYFPIVYDAEDPVGVYVTNTDTTLNTAFTASDNSTTYAKVSDSTVSAVKRKAQSSDGALTVTFTALSDETPANVALFTLPNEGKLESNHSAITATMPTSSEDGYDVIYNAIEDTITLTSINDITTESTDANAVVYDLQGRRLTAPTSSGIYIINGVKVFIK